MIPRFSSPRLLAALGIAAGLGLSAVPSFAQCPGGPGMGPMGFDMSDPAKFTEMRAKRMQEYQQRLHNALKLAPDQEPAWKKFIDSHQPGPGPAVMAGVHAEWAKLTAPERADRMLEWSKARQERMAAHAAALKTFYDGLSAEQKKTFDEFHAANRGGGKGRRGAGGMAPAAQ